MPIVARVDPKSVFSPEEWRRLTARSSLRGMWLVAHVWGTIAAAIALVTLWPNPLTWLVAVMVVGTRQLGLAILMHEAAHGGLHANRTINEWVGQWLCAVPVGADLQSYRSYHLQHHKFTQQPEDPDLSLSAPFPITKESFARKAVRDLTGQTFVKQRLPLLLSLFKPGNSNDEVSHESFVSSGADKMARFLGAQCAAVRPVLDRRRRHLVWGRLGARDGDLAAAGDADPQHRRARLHLDRRRPVQPCPHHEANPIERLLIAPYWVNYHAEHHLFMYLPCYRLREAHRLLIAKGLVRRMQVAPGYLDVMRLATSRQPA